MYYIYVLRSLKNNKRYVGYTSKDPKIRLHEHNTGSNIFTSRNSPYLLIHSEALETKTDAIKREKYLKSGNGRKFLDQINNKPM